MDVEKAIANLSREFRDSEEAFYRLDSIANLASGKDLGGSRVRDHLRTIVRISKNYGDDEMKALGILEAAYSAGTNDSHSALSKYLGKKGTRDPVWFLYERFQKYAEGNTQPLQLKALQNIAEEGLGGFEIRHPPPSGTGLVMRQRTGGAKTQS